MRSPVGSVRSYEELVRALVDAGSREHYEDAALYDYEYRRRKADVAFYRTLVGQLAPGAEVLDLGAGTGRLAIPLLRDGYRVCAVDLSQPMLDRLAERAARLPEPRRRALTVRRADLRTLALGRRFPLAIAAFNVVEHLYSYADITGFFRRVAAHLAPGGRFAFDVAFPELAWLCRDPRRRWARTRFTHPTTRRQLVYSTNHDYDPVSQVVLIRLYYEDEAGATRIVKLSQRKFFPAELEALLVAGGLEVVERHGDFAGGPLDADATSQVVVCRPATARRAASAVPSRAPTARPKPPSEKKTTSRRKKNERRRGA